MSDTLAVMWERTKESAVLAYRVLKEAGQRFGRDRVSRMAAAVAYRTLFALAPLLLISIFVLGLFLGGNESAQAEILNAVEDFAGATVAEAVGEFLDSVSATGNTAGIIGFVLLLWTASSLFLELQNDLNDIFGVSYDHTSGLVATIRKRGLAFLWAFGLGVVLVAVWLLNGIWGLIGNFVPEGFRVAHGIIAIVTPIISLALLPFVFGLTFQVLSRVKVRWRAIWWGSFFTSVVFIAAAYGTGLYFSLSTSSALSAVGSIFIIILLAFILAAVLLLGAEVTKVVDEYIEAGEQALETEPDELDVVVAEAPPALPTAAVAAFLGGLFVGWRKSK